MNYIPPLTRELTPEELFLLTGMEALTVQGDMPTSKATAACAVNLLQELRTFSPNAFRTTLK